MCPASSAVTFSARDSRGRLPVTRIAGLPLEFVLQPLLKSDQIPTFVVRKQRLQNEHLAVNAEISQHVWYDSRRRQMASDLRSKFNAAKPDLPIRFGHYLDS